jgi:hypothetical protein
MDAELYKPFKLCLKILKTLGIWHDGTQTWTYFLVGHLMHFVAFGVFFVGLLVSVCNEKENLVTVVDVIMLLASYSSLVVKTASFYWKINKIKKNLDVLDAMLKFSAEDQSTSREILKRRVDFGFKVFKAFLISAFMTCTFAAFVPIFTHELPYKLWFPFDTENSFIGFWIASVFLIVYSFVAGFIDMSLDMLPVIFITFAIGSVEELTDRISRIGEESKPRKAKPGADMKAGSSKSINKPSEKQAAKDLVKCIEIQQKIKEFTKEIQQNFSLPIFAQELMSSVILCSNAFTLSLVCIDF